VGDEVARRRRRVDKVLVLGGTLGALLRRKSKCALEKLEERCLSGVGGSDDENARGVSANETVTTVRRLTHLKGVGSFLLRTLRGLLMVLTALLA
jgi:hypothetical protein